ncbi:hypothetical protein KIH39_15600 [Telmatocola sphagniphila]|uniref:Uncharacterized protein n=1 Tax=Telmatocola sphagniphila TaxID=1123043 RepID=A0A8E6B377_9BACT|nr:hypothetical protein [Telmatocola sphagniphila]QVL30276.1 hypothetical protein KIH39_15600 [Telmatocola sphagniphila]
MILTLCRSAIAFQKSAEPFLHKTLLNCFTNPMAFVNSIRCPLRLFEGEDGRDVNIPLALAARKAGKDCEIVNVTGNHQEMVSPSVKKLIEWFRQLK